MIVLIEPAPIRGKAIDLLPLSWDMFNARSNSDSMYYDISLEQYFSTSQAELQSAERTGAYIQECLTA